MSLPGTYYFLSTRRVFLPYLREVKESPVFVAPDLLINVLVAEVNKRTSFLTKRF